MGTIEGMVEGPNHGRQYPRHTPPNGAGHGNHPHRHMQDEGNATDLQMLTAHATGGQVQTRAPFKIRSVPAQCPFSARSVPVQWLSRGRYFAAIFWYFTAGLSVMPLSNWSTMPRWISCQGVWWSG